MSLRNRVTLGTLAILGVGLAIISIGLNLLLASRMSKDASAVLASRAEAEVSTFDTSSGTLQDRAAPNDSALDEHSWAFDASGRAIENAPASKRLDSGVRRLARVTQPTNFDVTEHVRLRGQPIRSPDGRRLGTVVVGVSMDPYRETERIAGGFTAVLALSVLAGGALVARRVVDAALRPVADMTARAAEWSENDLHRRFALGPPRDELTALAATLDGLLGRIDAALRHEQRFSAELAHELRTPLAHVRGEAELALRSARSDEQLRDALQRVLIGTDRMAAVIDTLLAVARSDAAHAAGSSDAVSVARTVQQLVQPAAEAHARHVEVTADAELLSVGAAEDVVAGALHPLLENALRYAARDVEVRLGRADGQIVIAVRDDGAGVDVEEAERIFEPGVSAGGGAGLGLPLARRLARAAGGDVIAIPGRGGHFELRLPA